MTAPSDARDQLAAHVLGARWFGGKGRAATLGAPRRVATLPLADPSGPTDPAGTPGAPGAGVLVVDLVPVTYADAAPGEDPEVYQVPLALRPAPVEGLEQALVGSWTEPDLGPVHAYDAVHDRTAMAVLLAAFAGTAPDGRRDVAGLWVHRLAGHELDADAPPAPFSGEQSNSSVFFGEDALLKLFRKVTPGANPDVAIHEVLTRAGSDAVARLYGWLEVPADDGAPGQVLQLGMLQQFLRTASDGWGLALASVRDLLAQDDVAVEDAGGDFAGEAARLGATLADTHRLLAEHFPTEDRPADAAVALADAMDARLAVALEVVPDLHPHVRGLRAAFDRVRGLPGLPVQRVHGDLHLGQTLRTTRGWKIVDFEGEPAKPLRERVLPDSPWRDVAGMLRSFDYAPRVVERSWEGDALPPVAADLPGLPDQVPVPHRTEQWSAHNRDAFVAAYAGRALEPEEDVLLTAYVADKAVYECVYETRNRPDWTSIPLAAVARLAGGGEESA